MKGLTPKQKEVLRVIENYQRKHKSAPTQEEIARIMKTSQASVWAKLNALKKKGALEFKNLFIINGK